MADAATVAQLATAAGTLVLAVATFSSVRSSQRSARVAERSLMIGLRPVLVPSRATDPAVEVRFGDRRMVAVGGGMAGVEEGDDVFYFVIPLRNVGAGLAVLHGWQVRPGTLASGAYLLGGNPAAPTARPRRQATRPDPEDFRTQQLDLYIPAGDTGNWLGAVRDPDDGVRSELRAALDNGDRITIDLLYGDHEGGQRTISRFGLMPTEDGEQWTCGVLRHWSVEGADPRED